MSQGSAVTTQTQVVVTRDSTSAGSAITADVRPVVTKVVETTVVAGTAQGIPGPPGPPGAAGSAYLRVPTNSPISGNMVVCAIGGVCVYADCYNVDSAIGAVGVTARAETTSHPVDVQVTGEMEEPSWNWRPGFVFLGVNGRLTQDLPSDAAVSLVVGRVVSATRLLIQVGRPVVL